MATRDPRWVLKDRPSFALIIGLVLTGICALVSFSFDVFNGAPVQFFIALALALAPVPLLLAAVLALDRMEPEPRSNLVFAFAWGAGVAVLVAGVINSLNLHYIIDTAQAVGGQRAQHRGHVRRARGGGDDEGPGAAGPAQVPPGRAGRADRRRHLRQHGRPRLRHERERQLLPRRAVHLRRQGAGRHGGAARHPVAAGASAVHLDDRGRRGVRGPAERAGAGELRAGLTGRGR